MPNHQIATNFAHDTTAMLSCHVQNFVVLLHLDFNGNKLKFPSNEISFKFGMWWKNSFRDGFLEPLSKTIFSSTIEIWLKIQFLLIQIIIKCLLENFHLKWQPHYYGMCKTLLWSDDPELNHSKIRLPNWNKSEISSMNLVPHRLEHN